MSETAILRKPSEAHAFGNCEMELAADKIVMGFDRACVEGDSTHVMLMMSSNEQTGFAELIANGFLTNQAPRGVKRYETGEFFLTKEFIDRLKKTKVLPK